MYKLCSKDFNLNHLLIKNLTLLGQLYLNIGDFKLSLKFFQLRLENIKKLEINKNSKLLNSIALIEANSDLAMVYGKLNLQVFLKLFL